MKIPEVSITRKCLYGVLALVAGMPSLLWAQGNAAQANAGAQASARPQANFITVRILHYVPSEQANMEAALADLAKARGAAGEPFFHVYQSARGPGGYMIVQVDRQFGNSNLPPVQNPPAVVSRLQKSEAEAPRVITLRMYPEISTGGGSATAAPPGEFMRVRVTTTSPGNNDAAFALQRDQLVPAYKKAGGNRRTGRVAAGGNVNEFVEFSYMKQLGRADWNLAESMGQKDFDQMVGRLRALNTSEQIFWYRFRPDLSFSSAPQR